MKKINLTTRFEISGELENRALCSFSIELEEDGEDIFSIKELLDKQEVIILCKFAQKRRGMYVGDENFWCRLACQDRRKITFQICTKIGGSGFPMKPETWDNIEVSKTFSGPEELLRKGLCEWSPREGFDDEYELDFSDLAAEEQRAMALANLKKQIEDQQDAIEQNNRRIRLAEADNRVREAEIEKLRAAIADLEDSN